MVREIGHEALGKEATLCAAVTQASCQGEEYGARICVRDLGSDFITLESFRVITSRVRHGDDLCCCES